MSKPKSTGTAPAAVTSTHVNDASKDDGINAHMLQNVLLIWLDANINENSSDCQNTITHLRTTANTIYTFTDGQECLQFLEGMVDEKACMIISGSLGQQIVPRVHNLYQVDSIFIFCGNKKYHEEWAKDWPKIKDVFTEIGPICEALKQATQQCEQNAISISIISDNDGGVKKTGNRLDPSFMYTQIMKDIFLNIVFNQKHIDEFIEYCSKAFSNNPSQLKYVDKLAREYHQHTPIWWYTCECFLYPMLNRALRTMNANLMIKMGFFIGDLHRHIAQLHQKQFASDSSKQPFIVYRGQGMDNKAFKKMAANKGGLISFNSFLSTSKMRSNSLRFARRALADAQTVGIFFVMNIDPARSSTPFASVVDMSDFGEQENEVLFSMHTVFRIGEITRMDDNPRLVQVQLDLASDKDNDLRELIDIIHEETSGDEEGWYRLGLVLRRMSKFAKAQQVYEELLAQETEESEKAPIYHQLGLMKYEQKKYTEAIEYYEKSIEIEEKQIPCRDQNLANSYNNIGNVYYEMENYPKAVSSYERSQAVRQQSHPPNDFDLTTFYNNIGNIYYKMDNYPKAFSSHEKALVIKQRLLPATHPNLAMAYYNLGKLHKNKGNYWKAHSYFECAVDVGQHSLPTDHPHFRLYKKELADTKKKL